MLPKEPIARPGCDDPSSPICLWGEFGSGRSSDKNQRRKQLLATHSNTSGAVWTSNPRLQPTQHPVDPTLGFLALRVYA